MVNPRSEGAVRKDDVAKVVDDMKGELGDRVEKLVTRCLNVRVFWSWGVVLGCHSMR